MQSINLSEIFPLEFPNEFDVIDPNVIDKTFVGNKTVNGSSLTPAKNNIIKTVADKTAKEPKKRTTPKITPPKDSISLFP